MYISYIKIVGNMIKKNYADYPWQLRHNILLSACLHNDVNDVIM